MALLSNLLDLLLPRTCPMCGVYRQAGDICPECIASLPRTEQALLRQNSTEELFANDKRVDKAAAYLFFEKDHPIQHVVHKMKYADQPMIGYQLGRQAAMEFQYTDFLDGIERIVPMPLHPKRLRERGYNQAEYIARGIGDVIGVPVDTTHVVRAKNTPKQALQSGEGRLHNVANAFEVHHPEQLYHQHILVVDDLITTGETMRSCLKAMHAIRGAQFSVFALCKAR